MTVWSSLFFLNVSVQCQMYNLYILLLSSPCLLFLLLCGSFSLIKANHTTLSTTAKKWKKYKCPSTAEENMIYMCVCVCAHWKLFSHLKRIIFCHLQQHGWIENYNGKLNKSGKRTTSTIWSYSCVRVKKYWSHRSWE